MNERIRELAEQAKKHSLDAMIKITDREQALKVYSESYDTKFAELIVQDCADLCEHESNDDEYDQYDMGQSVKAENIKTEIKQHFGVEETRSQKMRDAGFTRRPKGWIKEEE